MDTIKKELQQGLDELNRLQDETPALTDMFQPEDEESYEEEKKVGLSANGDY